MEYFEVSASQGGATGPYREPFMHIAKAFHDVYETKRGQLITQFSS